MRSYQLGGGLLALLLASASAQAQAADPAGTTAQDAVADSAAVPPATADVAPPAAEPADDKGWKLAGIGYLWVTGIKGQTDVIGPLAPVDLDLSFGDILKGFKFVAMGAGEARKDRFVVMGDFMFVHIDGKKGIGIRDPDFLDAELDSRTAAVTALVGYSVVKQADVTIDLLAGGRFNFFKTTLQLEGPNRSAEGSVKQTWLDPIIATRIRAPLDDKWGLNLYGDIGGIIMGSDLTWQGIATIDYKVSRKMSIGAGWRIWDWDYDKGVFLYDARESGPILTFRTQF